VAHGRAVHQPTKNSEKILSRNYVIKCQKVPYLLDFTRFYGILITVKKQRNCHQWRITIRLKISKLWKDYGADIISWTRGIDVSF